MCSNGVEIVTGHRRSSVHTSEASRLPYPPAPFRGPSGCEGYVCNCIPSVFCYPFCNYLFFQSTSLQLPVCSLPVCQSDSRSLQTGVGIFDFELSTGPGDRRVTTTWVYSLNSGPSRVSLKNHQNSSLSPGPSKVRKSEPKVTKRHQIHLKPTLRTQN